MRAMKEYFDCKLGDFVGNGLHFTFGERSTKNRNGEIETPNKIFRLDRGEKDPYRALKEFISHRPEGIDNFYLHTIDSQKMNILRQLCGQLADIRYQSASTTTIEKLPVSGSQQNREQGQVSSAGATFHSSVLNHCTISGQYSSHWHQYAIDRWTLCVFKTTFFVLFLAEVFCSRLI